MLLAEAIKSFIAYKVNRYGSTNATEVTYKSNMHDFMKFTGDIDVSQITITTIDNYALEVSNRGYKPKTTKNKIVIVRSFIRYLYSKQLSDIRPESIDVPRVQETESNFLDPDEQLSLISCIQSPRDKAIILTMLKSGLRISELVNLRTDDLYHRSIVVRCGKGKKPRVTFIDDETEQAIEEYKRTKKYTHYLFTNQGGQRFSRQYITQLVTIYGQKADTHKHISAHTLRHTFATNMLQRGARIEDVQPLMGHANIQTTRLYMHFTNEYLHERYDKVMAKS